MRLRLDLVEILSMRQSPGWEVAHFSTMASFYQLRRFLDKWDRRLEQLEWVRLEHDQVYLIALQHFVTRALDLVEFLDGEEVVNIPRQWHPLPDLKAGIDLLGTLANNPPNGVLL